MVIFIVMSCFTVISSDKKILVSDSVSHTDFRMGSMYDITVHWLQQNPYFKWMVLWSLGDSGSLVYSNVHQHQMLFKYCDKQLPLPEKLCALT